MYHKSVLENHYSGVIEKKVIFIMYVYWSRTSTQKVWEYPRENYHGVDAISIQKRQLFPSFYS